MANVSKTTASIPKNYVRLDGSERRHGPSARLLGPAKIDETLTVTIVMRRRPDGPPVPDHSGTLVRVARSATTNAMTTRTRSRAVFTRLCAGRLPRPAHAQEHSRAQVPSTEPSLPPLIQTRFQVSMNGNSG
jgi:hypothetical protein